MRVNRRTKSYLRNEKRVFGLAKGIFFVWVGLLLGIVMSNPPSSTGFYLLNAAQFGNEYCLAKGMVGSSGAGVMDGLITYVDCVGVDGGIRHYEFDVGIE